MVGGPLHGQTRNLPYFRSTLPMHYLMPHPTEVDDNLDPLVLTYRQYQYDLRWYRSPRQWMEAEQQPAYVCMEEPTPKLQLPPDPTEQDIHYARVAESLWHHAFEATLPGCVVPGCTEKGRLTFTAAEHGRLAGRDWQRGDEIRLCPNHGHTTSTAPKAPTARPAR